MFSNSPWSLHEVKQYERAMRKTLPKAVLDWVDRKYDQKFDSDVRLFIYLNSSHIWHSRKTDRNATESAFNAMLSPPDLSSATPFNNLFLRFPDYSPFFWFRRLDTTEGFELYCVVCISVGE